MFILYDNPISTNAQKVRLVLAEKALDFESRILDLQAGDQFQPDYLMLNPNAQVPTLVDGERVFRESTVISEYLEDICPEPSLLPRNPALRAEMRWFTEQTISWMSPMINSLNVALVFRHIYARKPKQQLDEFWEANPNPIQLSRQRSCHDEGVKSPYVQISLQRYRSFIIELNARLEMTGPWLLGEAFTLADTALFPYLYRLNQMGFERISSKARAYNLWFDAMTSRKSVKVEIVKKIPKNILLAHQNLVKQDQRALDLILVGLGV